MKTNFPNSSLQLVKNLYSILLDKNNIFKRVSEALLKLIWQDLHKMENFMVIRTSYNLDAFFLIPSHPQCIHSHIFLSLTPSSKTALAKWQVPLLWKGRQLNQSNCKDIINSVALHLLSLCFNTPLRIETLKVQKHFNKTLPNEIS